MDKCNESFNVVDDFLSIKTKDLNVKVFNMLTRINELKNLAKHILCDCECKFNSAI